MDEMFDPVAQVVAALVENSFWGQEGHVSSFESEES